MYKFNVLPITVCCLWKVKVTQSCPTLCDPMDYTVHGILQARILEWVAIPFSRGSSQTRDWTQVSHIAGGLFISWATREAWSFLITLFKISTPLPTAAFLGPYPALYFSIVLTNTSGILHIVHIHLLWVSCSGCKSKKVLPTLIIVLLCV